MEYLCKVGIHGVYGLTFAIKDYAYLPNPYCQVTVFNEAPRDTNVLENTASGSFNYTFTYTAKMKPEEMALQDVLISVIDNGSVYTTHMGQVVFSLRKVWEEPKRTVQKCWVPIFLVETPGDIRGWIQVSVGIYGSGDIIPKIGSLDDDNDDDGSASLRSRLVKPPDVNPEDKGIMQVVVKIHEGNSIRELPGAFTNSVAPFVTVEFNGSPQSTQIKYETNPVWNE